MKKRINYRKCDVSGSSQTEWQKCRHVKVAIAKVFRDTCPLQPIQIGISRMRHSCRVCIGSMASTCTIRLAASKVNGQFITFHKDLCMGILLYDRPMDFSCCLQVWLRARNITFPGFDSLFLGCLLYEIAQLCELAALLYPELSELALGYPSPP